MGLDMCHHFFQIFSVRNVRAILSCHLLLVVRQFIASLLVHHSLGVHHVDLLQHRTSLSGLCLTAERPFASVSKKGSLNGSGWDFFSVQHLLCPSLVWQEQYGPLAGQDVVKTLGRFCESRWHNRHESPTDHANSKKLFLECQCQSEQQNSCWRPAGLRQDYILQYRLSERLFELLEPYKAKIDAANYP